MTKETNTIKLHRVFAAPADRVYRAFLDPDALAKWVSPHGYTCKVHELDARVGGKYRMSFTNFRSGKGHSFGGIYLELKPNELLRYTDIFEDPNLSGDIQVTIRLREVSCGTEVNITQENLPAVLPLEQCYIGWQQSLAQFAQLVEAQTPDDV